MIGISINCMNKSVIIKREREREGRGRGDSFVYVQYIPGTSRQKYLVCSINVLHFLRKMWESLQKRERLGVMNDD